MMKSGNPSDLENVCRFCLKKSDNLIGIFENAENTSFSLRIMACVSLEVQVQDALPKKFCNACRYQLESTYIFRVRSKNSDSKLRRHLRLINAGKKSNVLEENDDDEDECAESQQFIREYDEKQKVAAAEKWEKAKIFFENEKEKIFEEKLKQAREDERQRIFEEANKKLREEEENKIKQTSKESTSSTYLVRNSLAKKTENRKSKEPTLKHLVRNPLTMKTGGHQNIELLPMKESLEGLDEHGEDIEEVYEIHEYDDEENESFDEFITEGEHPHPEIEFIIDENPCHEFLYEEEGIENAIELAEDSAEEMNTLEEDNDDNNDDAELAAVRKVVEAELAHHPGFNSKKRLAIKLEKSSKNITKAEVTGEDGAVILMEFTTDDIQYKDSVAENDGGEGMFPCLQCPGIFDAMSKLTQHIAIHNEKGKTCQICNKWYPTRSSFERHNRVHTGEKPFKCFTCGKCFIQKEILKRHSAIHTNERPYKCTDCDKCYIQKDLLRQHFDRKHRPNPIKEVHCCTLCPKTFAHSSGLSRHMSVHQGKKYGCEYCRREFSDKSALKRHKVTLHSDIIGQATPK